MKAWVCVLTAAVLVSACVLNKKSEQSESYAITDGRLTLGVVPSVNDGGMQAYRLLLCKNTSSYNEQDFSDPTKCRAALIDSKGRDVVLQSEALLRPFGEKSNGAINVAAGVAGVALIGVGAFGLHKWFIKGSHMLGRGIRNANKVSKPDTGVIDELTKVLNDADAEKNKDLIAKLVELKGAVKEGNKDEITKKIGEINNTDIDIKTLMGSEFGGYDATTVTKIKEMADELKATDKKFAAQLQKVADGNPYTLGEDGRQFYEERAFGWMDNLRKQLAQANETSEFKDLNEFIENNSEKLGKLNGMKVNDLAEGDRQLYTKFGEFSKKFSDSKAIKNFRKSMGLEDNVSMEKAVADVATLSSKAGDTAKDLHMVELKRDAVRSAIFDLKAGKNMNEIVKEVQDEIDNLDVPIMPLIKDAKVKELVEKNSESIDEQTKISEAFEELQAIVGQYKVIRPHEAVTEENGTIKVVQELMSTPEAQDEKAIDSLTNILRAERDRFNDIKTLKEKVNVYGNDKINPADLTDTLKALDQEHAQLTVKLMDESKNIVQKAVQEVDEKKRKWWGLGGLGAATAGAVMVSLNNSIWGNGEKQLGKHWSQIFSTNSDFADATTVKDLPTILTKLARVLGHNVNRKALALDGDASMHDRTLGGR